jgi:hypothetical protein
MMLSLVVYVVLIMDGALNIERLCAVCRFILNVKEHSVETYVRKK